MTNEQHETTTTRIRIRRRYLLATVGYLFACLGLFAAALVFYPPWLPVEVRIVTVLASLLFTIVFGRVLVSCYLWIEVEGDSMRGRMLMKRRISEWKVGHIVTVNGFGLEMLGLKPPHGSAEDATNRLGYEIAFRDGTTLMLSKHEMGGLDDFLIALADQIKQRG